MIYDKTEELCFTTGIIKSELHNKLFWASLQEI